ncbi:Carbonic anhydrase or acetyltransferase, isoleucine patch superfamily [Paraburkholderia steynii]|uniref:Carbonic anhydrase or acetyltransferase, isoleucine patch superfamily n=1 Tax=Paraburkholderia steynii TaxID=1245441 RepID=A0A7Z7BAZ8_9BURK|nr:gamma carbonic anhydrase family protein [Paraburkholderia steynii]SDI50454.1 Carbonic anhydrase or acetyltransferase, isoleucine patch superfamily [Paraburkholderia steynii]
MSDTILPDYAAVSPRVHSSAFVGIGSVVIGDVTIGERASIWFNCVLRGDVQRIKIGQRTNIQDGTVVHCTTGGRPTLIGDDVSVGHGAILHSCTIEDTGFVGFGARVLDGATIQRGGMLAAGAVLTPGKTIGSGELWAGNPARLLRILDGIEADALAAVADRYVALALRYLNDEFNLIKR